MTNRVKEEQVLYDAHGRKTHVILSIERYKQLLNQLEDRADVKAMKLAEGEKSIPWTKAKRELLKKVR